ncbi:hypothetical protein [Priestia sp. AB]|uniref:hypothetical protein n=1 Tax=Priestia sp. AB TaxID=3020890 RepID=UPI00232FE5F9|nr:hypothetical protein [Priestia sp. AB]MDC0705733.1 hypothetical protein [Priestia sp. AB]
MDNNMVDNKDNMAVDVDSNMVGNSMDNMAVDVDSNMVGNSMDNMVVDVDSNMVGNSMDNMVVVSALDMGNGYMVVFHPQDLQSQHRHNHFAIKVVLQN